MDGCHLTKLTPGRISLRLLRALRLRLLTAKGGKESVKERIEKETIARQAIMVTGGSILQAWTSENTFASLVER